MGAPPPKETEPKRIKPPPPVKKGVGPTLSRKVEIPASDKDKRTETHTDLKLGLTRSDFKTEEFIRVIRQKGRFGVWRKALFCPCNSARSDQPKINCSICDGSGYYYVHPLHIRAVMGSMDRKTRMLERYGEWLEGSMSVTTEPQFRLGNRDAIELKDTLMVFDELLKKGNRRGIRAQLPTNVDSARYRIVNVTAMLYLDADETIVHLREKTHYELTADGWIHWLDAAKTIAKDTVISIRYEFHPIYIVISHPQTLREEISLAKSSTARVIALPINALAKLDYLLTNTTPYMEGAPPES